MNGCRGPPNKSGASCSSFRPGAQVGPAPATVCFCNQPGAYLRKDTMTTTYQAEISALAELLKTAYSSMRPCNPCPQLEASEPVRGCYRPQAWMDESTSGCQAGCPPSRYRQAAIPPCSHHMAGQEPEFSMPPPKCARAKCHKRPALPSSFRVLLGAAEPASALYATGYSEYGDSIGQLGGKRQWQAAGRASHHPGGGGGYANLPCPGSFPPPKRYC